MKSGKPSNDWLEKQPPESKPSPETAASRGRKPKPDPSDGKPAETSLDRVIAEFRDAVPNATSPIDYLDELDRRLVLFGWPDTTDWWKRALRRFYATRCAQLVLRVGRRGGKSSTLCRIAMLEALLGEHHVAPGDTAVVAIVSKDRPDAKERLNTIQGILDVLGVKYKATAERIDLADKDMAFRVYTATVAGVSGFSGICVICDEVAKWMDKEAGANPATEVLASVRPTMAGLPNARIFLSSSPWGRWDAHARAFDAGDGPIQLVEFAETWVARPALTQEDTQRLEPDHRVWLREYGAVPMEGAEDSLLPADALTRCMPRPDDRRIEREVGVSYVAAMAPSLAHGAWSIVIAARLHDGQAIVDFAESRGELEPHRLLLDVKLMLQSYGLTSVLSTKDGLGHLEAAQKLGVHVRVATTPLPELANDMLARISRGEDDLPPNPELRADLLALRRVDSDVPDEFAVRLADVERYPSFAVPAMVALFEASRLPAPKTAQKKTIGEQMLADLVQRNRVEYAGAEE